MNNRQRVRIVRLPSQLEPDQIADIQNELHNLDAILDLELNGKVLKIEYTFPVVDFSTIWQLVKKHAGNSQFGLVANLAYALRGYTEQVERQHLLSQSGWDIYVRDIFVASHLKDAARRAAQPRKPWQQAKRPENPDK